MLIYDLFDGYRPLVGELLKKVFSRECRQTAETQQTEAKSMRNCMIFHTKFC